jgi:hypothetical protein
MTPTQAGKIKALMQRLIVLLNSYVKTIVIKKRDALTDVLSDEGHADSR